MNVSLSPPGSYLCYGDLIALEVRGIDDCHNGGFLGSENINSSTTRTTSAGSIDDAGSSTSTKYGRNQRIGNSKQDVINNRILQIAPSTEINGEIHLPSVFFMANIFEVVASIGFESPGEPVLYGSRIKLCLVSTEEYLISDNDSEFLHLLPREECEKKSNEFYFTVKPKFNVRTEGDQVNYRDYITLTDSFGRKVNCLSSSRIILSKNSGQGTGFYIVPYVPCKSVADNVMKGGDVVQFYHKVENSFLVASREKPQRVNALRHDTTILLNSKSFWCVEVIQKAITKESGRDFDLNGVVYHGSPVR